MIALIVDSGDECGLSVCDASAVWSLYKMRSGRMSILMTGFALLGLN